MKADEEGLVLNGSRIKKGCFRKFSESIARENSHSIETIAIVLWALVH